MARKEKYYGTNTIIYGEKLKKLKEFGYKGSHNQFRIVCKATSMAEANRIAESYGLSKNTFKRNYTSETGNKIELEMADKYNFIVCVDGILGNEFVSMKELI